MKRFLMLSLATLSLVSAALPQSAQAQEGFGSPWYASPRFESPRFESNGYHSNGYNSNYGTRQKFGSSSNYGYGSGFRSGRGLSTRPVDSYGLQQNFDWNSPDWRTPGRISNSGYGYRREPCGCDCGPCTSRNSRLRDSYDYGW